MGGVLEGQRSAASGRDSENAPIFVPAGIDTTVTVASDTTPTADTSRVPVYRFAVVQGKLRRVQPERQPGDPDQLRPAVPGNPDSLERLLALRARRQVGVHLRHWIAGGSELTCAVRIRSGIFDYTNLYNPPALFGSRRWSEVLTLNWTQNLARPDRRALALELYLSYQRDHSITSPLTSESELATRDPSVGS